jgi:hypothetical protein
MQHPLYTVKFGSYGIQILGTVKFFRSVRDLLRLREVSNYHNRKKREENTCQFGIVKKCLCKYIHTSASTEENKFSRFGEYIQHQEVVIFVTKY